MRQYIYLLAVLGTLYFIKKIAKLQGRVLYSPPYKSTVYIEPSKVNLQLQPNNKLGFSLGWWYMAIYKNQHVGLSTIWCLATDNTIKRLEDEFYFNNENRY